MSNTIRTDIGPVFGHDQQAGTTVLESSRRECSGDGRCEKWKFCENRRFIICDIGF